jgi:hypothetical protein
VERIVCGDVAHLRESLGGLVLLVFPRRIGNTENIRGHGE